MPLRYLFTVGVIHVFPWINEHYIHSAYLKDQNNSYPETVEYMIFSSLCIVAYFCNDEYIPPAEYNLQLKTEHYSSRGLVNGSTNKHYIRQLGYDISVYCIPCIAVAVSVPFLRDIINFILIFITFYFCIYDNIVKKIWLKSTTSENETKAAFRLKSYPNPDVTGNGWFRLAYSHELGCGQVEYIQALNRNYALFRGQDGIVRCLDAYCVHLGANMAIGGTVVNNCLQCPFHKWEFGGDGKCTHIPYSDKISPSTTTKSYHIHEYYGMILVWHENDTESIKSNGNINGNISNSNLNTTCAVEAAEKEKKLNHNSDNTTTNANSKSNHIPKPPGSPLYYPPLLPHLGDMGDMVFRGFRSMSVNMNIREFCENSTDFAHFAPLHGHMTFPFTPIEMPGITVNHRPDWIPGEGSESHLAWFHDSADLNLAGQHAPWTHAKAVITICGPAGLVFFSFDTPIGRIVLFQTHTPETPLRLKTSFYWFATATMPRILVWYIVGNWVAQWQNDISIWENKLYANKPILVKGDGPMMKQRRWYSQFFTKSVLKNVTNDW